MTLTSILVSCGLRAKITPDATIHGDTSKATVGTVTEHAPAADVIYAVKATAAAASNVATLTVATGNFAQTTGSPTILRSSVDVQGESLPTATKIHALRLRSSGSGTITIAGSSSGKFPAITLASGQDVVVKYPDAGTTLAGTETLAATFSATGGILEVEALAKV